MSELNKPHFQDPNKAREYLEALRWPDGPICPHCGSVNKGHYQLAGKAHRPGLWKCKDCREQFTVTVGTVFERSKIALNVWLQAFYFMCSSKKGMSAHQLHRVLGVQYRTAWFMAHRIREAMTSYQPAKLLGSDPTGGNKGGIVEADATFFGNIKGAQRRQGSGHKMKIVSLVERNGMARSFHLPTVTSKNVKAVMRSQISNQARIMTDDGSNFIAGGRQFKSHQSVNHSADEYVRGDVHTNTVEGFFSLLKRGLVGTYHHVSEAHLQRYCREFDFRYNHRAALGVNDVERTKAALKGIGGKRLTYETTYRQQAQFL